MGPEGLDVAIPPGEGHGDHRLEARAELRKKSVDVTARCPGCGRTARWPRSGLPRQASAELLAANDLQALAAGALRRFRQTIPASCALALAEGIMGG